jgi:YHS domain-containing protein
MIRAILYLVISIFLITFLRMVVGILLKTMKEMMSAPGGPTPVPNAPPTVSVGGELKRDPVCGTFVPSNSSFQKSLNGQSYCFCSAECRDKYAG